MTVIPIGLQTSDPSPLLKASGSIPSIVVNAVIKTGLNLDLPDRAIASTIRRNSQSPLSRLKSTSYLESILARQEAREAGVDEALCLDEKGFLAEGSMSNIFLVADGRLKTPGYDSGILPGITRQTVLELATKLGIDILECNIRLDELFQAQEAFFTGSLIEVMPLTEIEGKPIGSGKPGSVTRRLIEAYRRLVLYEENAV